MDTIGTINLKIERLVHRLNILQQQMVLSSPYPHHQLALRRHYQQLKCELDYLRRQRQQLLWSQSETLLNLTAPVF